MVEISLDWLLNTLRPEWEELDIGEMERRRERQRREFECWRMHVGEREETKSNYTEGFVLTDMDQFDSFSMGLSVVRTCPS